MDIARQLWKDGDPIEEVVDRATARFIARRESSSRRSAMTTTSSTTASRSPTSSSGRCSRSPARGSSRSCRRASRTSTAWRGGRRGNARPRSPCPRSRRGRRRAAIKVAGRLHGTLPPLARARSRPRRQHAGAAPDETGRRTGRGTTTPLRTSNWMTGTSWSSARTEARTCRPPGGGTCSRPLRHDHAREALGGRHGPRCDGSRARMAVAHDHRDQSRLCPLRKEDEQADPAPRLLPR